MAFLTPGGAGVGAVVGITAVVLLGIVMLAARAVANKPRVGPVLDLGDIDGYAAHQLGELRQQIRVTRLQKNACMAGFGLLAILEVALLFLGKVSTDPKMLGLAIVLVVFCVRGQFSLIEKGKQLDQQLADDVRTVLEAEEQLVIARTAADRAERILAVVHLVNSRLGH